MFKFILMYSKDNKGESEVLNKKSTFIIKLFCIMAFTLIAIILILTTASLKVQTIEQYTLIDNLINKLSELPLYFYLNK